MRGFAIAVAACALALGAASTAPAAVVEKGDWQAAFSAAEGEINTLTVTEVPDGVVFHDATATITSTTCKVEDAHEAKCPAVTPEPGRTALEVYLRDGNDDLTLKLLAGGPFDQANGGSTSQVWAGDGDDTLRGGALDDHFFGGAGSDTILAAGGRDFIAANDGEDKIYAGPGDDSIYTAYDGYESGSSTGDLPDEADVYVGGSGYDSLAYAWRTDDLRITPDGVADDGATGEGDQVGADLEELFGNAGDDHIEATLDPDRNEGYPNSEPRTTLYGAGGNDTLVGGPSNDGLMGGEGNDDLSGGLGRDGLQGEGGNDRMVGGPGPDGIVGENGADWIDARDGSTFLRIGPADDWVTCGLGDDTYLADYSEIYRMIPGEMGDGCNHHNNPPDPTHLLIPDESGTEHDGDVKLGVECPAKALGVCGGGVQVTIPAAEVSAASAGKRPPVVLAQGSVQVRRGRHKRAKLVLTKEGRKYFKRHSKAVARALARGKYSSLKRLKGRVKIRVQS